MGLRLRSVGKTTLVGSLTEIRPLRTEEPLSEPGAAVDRLDGVERKTTTTVALDFGRITIRENLVIYLFGTPGQERFWFMWDELARGALGAIVMADTRGWLTASRPWTTSSSAASRSWWGSTASTERGGTGPRRSGRRWTWILTCR
jgi:GTPase SAR1 family protein